ncbi:hypothetical protein [Oleisolibacter albus]|uniref:hypothetical protein n=1 Tax=Oleisolibacter albus TaxID=2171757 RepID=UPI0012D7074E|nr:hypothetical protein [Oleisolibacter albus]
MTIQALAGYGPSAARLSASSFSATSLSLSSLSVAGLSARRVSATSLSATSLSASSVSATGVSGGGLSGTGLSGGGISAAGLTASRLTATQFSLSSTSGRAAGAQWDEVRLTAEALQMSASALAGGAPAGTAAAASQTGNQASDQAGNPAGGLAGGLADAARDAVAALQRILDDPMQQVFKAIDALSAQMGDVFRAQGFSEREATALARQSGPLLKLKALTGGGPSLDLPPGLALGLEMQRTTLVTQVEFRQLDLQVSRSAEGVSLAVSVQSISVRAETSLFAIGLNQQKTDPLILDLDGDGVETVAPGKIFDIDGDGRLDATAWTGSSDALLALDRNGNGRIDNGTELFGDQNGAANGFEELARYDDNGDRAIDAGDSVFTRLILLDGDGRSWSLAEQGIVRIRLDAVVALREPTTGGETIARGQFERADGRRGRVDDVRFDARLDLTV